LVEYVDNGEEDWIGDDYTGEPFWNEKIELKINSKDNTITIKKVKDCWNREEVIKLIEKCVYKKQSAWKVGELDKFIEENLN